MTSTSDRSASDSAAGPAAGTRSAGRSAGAWCRRIRPSSTRARCNRSMVAPSSHDAQRVGGVLVVLAHLGDPGERGPETDQVLDAQ